jgi:hypothetical protein
VSKPSSSASTSTSRTGSLLRPSAFVSSFGRIVWLWIDARRSASEGWAWEVTMDGRFLSAERARALIQLLEDTISATRANDGSVPAALERIWKPHLALGPRRL